MKEFVLRRSSINKLRLKGSPYQYFCHCVFPTGKNNSYDSAIDSAIEVKCSMHSGDCCICEISSCHRPIINRWYCEMCNIYSHLKNDSSRYETPFQGFIRLDRNLFAAIQAFSRHPDWGNPNQYDIEISVGGIIQQYGNDGFWELTTLVTPFLKPKEEAIINPKYMELLHAWSKPPSSKSTMNAFHAALKGELYKDDEQQTAPWFPYGT